MMLMHHPVKLFLAYAHKDKKIRNKLVSQLQPLVNNDEIDLWCDQEIKPGAIWDDEIRRRLEVSEIFLLLVSADFIDSDYIQRVEFQKALELQTAGKAFILPVIARACTWQNVPDLHRQQVLPPEGRPIISKKWDSRDEPYTKVCQGVKKIVDEIRFGGASKGLERQVDLPNPPEIPPQKRQKWWWGLALLLLLVWSIWKWLFPAIDRLIQSSVSSTPPESSALHQPPSDKKNDSTYPSISTPAGSSGRDIPDASTNSDKKIASPPKPTSAGSTIMDSSAVRQSQLGDKNDPAHTVNSTSAGSPGKREEGTRGNSGTAIIIDPTTKDSYPEITGQVLDEEGHPLPGVTVKEKITNSKSVTKYDGWFYMNFVRIQPPVVLRFQFSKKGYKTGNKDFPLMRLKDTIPAKTLITNE